MALLTPNATYKMHGVTVNEKIIPDGTVWKDSAKAKKAGFSAGSLYKKQKKLSNGTGKVQTVTAHNTNDLDGVYDDGEQYTRATYNENMGSSRVHFYVDDVCAWQNLKAGTGMCPADPVGSAEVSWHSGDGSVSDGGNNTSLSIEIIMNDTADHDAKARDNGARVAAWLLWKHGLTVANLVTHTYWVNKSAGNKFDDVDEQCCNLVKNRKWCPAYIFASSNEATALKNWKAFKSLVKKYLDELNGTKAEADTPAPAGTLYRVQTGAFRVKSYADTHLAKVKAAGFDTYMVKVDSLYKIQVGAYSKKENAEAQLAKLKKAGFDAFITTKGGTAVAANPEPAKEIKVGSIVKVKQGAKDYNGNGLASFVYDRKHTVKEISGNRVVIAFEGVIVAAVHKNNLILL